MTDRKHLAVRLHPKDNVAVALSNLQAGGAIGEGLPRCQSPIPAGHKIALAAIPADGAIIKYGQVIGFAVRPIAAGNLVHTDSVMVKALDPDYAFGTEAAPTEVLPEHKRATFQGYVRADGRVGTRNYIGVLATVSCAAGVCRLIADAVSKEGLTRPAGVDGVVALGHGAGCCMPPTGDGLRILQRTLAGYARNPNFGAILLVGLGCETNQVENLAATMYLPSGPLLKHLTIQAAGGTANSVREGVSLIGDMLAALEGAQRRTVSAAHLVLGLECGGSDGYSGITANPALGAAVDLLVKNGGTAILSETPEIYGAEHLLTRRCIQHAVGEKLVEKIRWWEQYTQLHGAEINNNPTPGNKAGGITTILEKSLGAVAKAGTTSLMAVYDYAEPVTAGGMVFMDTPGYDVVSITGMIAGGANLIAFTTGRGTVCGFKPVPTLKLASNTAVYERMESDMDIDCGRILSGACDIGRMGEIIFDRILDTASGHPTKSERYGFGEDEFVPWPIGAVL